jgi:hypothetical protein
MKKNELHVVCRESLKTELSELTGLSGLDNLFFILNAILILLLYKKRIIFFSYKA